MGPGTAGPPARSASLLFAEQRAGDWAGEARGAGSHSAGHRRWAQGRGIRCPAGRGPEPRVCGAGFPGPGGRGRHLVGCKHLPVSPWLQFRCPPAPLPALTRPHSPAVFSDALGNAPSRPTVFPSEYGEGGGLAMSTRASVFQTIYSFPEKALAEICVLLAAERWLLTKPFVLRDRPTSEPSLQAVLARADVFARLSGGQPFPQYFTCDSEWKQRAQPKS